jgi:hypothetical protein
VAGPRTPYCSEPVTRTCACGTRFVRRHARLLFRARPRSLGQISRDIRDYLRWRSEIAGYHRGARSGLTRSRRNRPRVGACSIRASGLLASGGLGMPSLSKVRLAGKCDCSTSWMISAFSDAGYLMPRPPHPRSCFF